MFGRAKKAATAAARAAFEDPVFERRALGVAAVHVDDDPAVWVRTPHPARTAAGPLLGLFMRVDVELAVDGQAPAG